MFSASSFVIGTVVLVVLFAGIARRLRSGGASGTGSDRERSAERHREAQRREPPVDLGETRRVAITDFSEHHSGERHAVCKVEGFVVFVEDVPRDLAEGDVIVAEIRSFNRGHTSATAAFLERA
ncbi:TRAM domain-containing protein [Natrarchaeobaculum aegyptiacum]|uniref:RNA-binding protein n=1 Tax=Natrarchaeobaculum aegyptiacum TaxID=745377 RepID=A0A2Z2HQZ7_9EURY|nr:RNA-binding protein [Natrarchaeobaculum aegyptiacum]ARS89479.1 RNA-binding protein [Natrarchaeobaculum aegyptiacum]